MLLPGRTALVTGAGARDLVRALSAPLEAPYTGAAATSPVLPAWSTTRESSPGAPSVKSLRYAPRSPEDHRQAFREHSAILAAIRERSPEKAFQAMRQHLAASYRRTISIGSGARR
jgi:hypothetical protein